MAARTIDRALNLDVALAGRRSRKPNEIWVEESLGSMLHYGRRSRGYDYWQPAAVVPFWLAASRRSQPVAFTPSYVRVRCHSPIKPLCLF